MSEIEKNTSNEDEEISLIDLFSVVIRHRFMIILGTILVFVLFAGYLFVLPMLSKNEQNRGVTVKYSISVTSVPTGISSELPVRLRDLKTVVNSEFNDIIFLVKEIKKTNPFSDGSDSQLTDFEYNTYVQNLVKDKNITIAPSSIRDEIVITMKIPEQNLTKASVFVDNMIDSVNAVVDPVFLREVKKLEKTKQETYDEMVKSYSENSNISEAQILLLTVRQIKEFLEDYDKILKRELEPFVVLEPLGRLKKLAVTTVAAFFIFIFLAFLLNAIENIKQDPDASGKIKAAWIGGKLGKKE